MFFYILGDVLNCFIKLNDILKYDIYFKNIYEINPYENKNDQDYLTKLGTKLKSMSLPETHTEEKGQSN